MSDAEAKIGQIQTLEQGLQGLIQQKQQVQSTLLEIESASKELAHTAQAFKIIGNIMILKDKQELTTDLKDKLERTQVRLKSIEKQEEKTRERIRVLQEDVMAGLGKREE
jgi:prefoldin beta subunit